MFSDPKYILKQFGVYGEIKVADLGASGGYYTIAAARVIAEDGGVVYAIDLVPDLLTRIQKEARAAHVSNVEILLGNLEREGGTKLASGFIDKAILANTLFTIEDKEACAKEIARIIKPGGQLLVVDWKGSYNHMGPHPDHIVLQKDAETLFGRAGFVADRSIDAGSHHWGVVLIKS